MTCQYCGDDCTAAQQTVKEALKQAEHGMKKALRPKREPRHCEVCGAETTRRRFCSDKCRMQHKRQQVGYARPQQRYTAKRRTQAEIDEAINRIVDNAIKNGTCYNTATLAPT